MKKLATTLFGLFLVATSFASVNGNEVTLPINENNLKTTQVTRTATLNQVINIMAISKHNPRTKATGGPRVVIETCATGCEDDL